MKEHTPYLEEPEVLEESRVEVVTDWEEEEEDNYEPKKAQVINGKVYKPGMFVPGQSGNPKGRPKGKTLKEWCREYLATMSDTERMEFLSGIPKEAIWRLAEGNPSEDRNLTVTVPRPILGGLTQGEQTVNIDNTKDIGRLMEGEGT